MKAIALRVLLTFIIFLSACNSSRSSEGISFIAPLGRPPVDEIIWSPVNDSEILVSANYLQPGPAQVYLLDIRTGKKSILRETQRGRFGIQGWSPDGQSVMVYASPGTDGISSGQYLEINTTNGATQMIDESIAGRIYSPDGNWAVDMRFWRPRPLESIAELHLIDLQTNMDRLLMTVSDEARFLDPAWAPDSERFVLSVQKDKTSDLLVVDVRTGKAEQLTHGGINGDPAWAPEEDVIAYVSSPNGIHYKIHFIRPDGTCDFSLERVDDVLGITWSPDGKKLAYLSLQGIFYLDIGRVFTRSTAAALCPQ